MWAIGRALGSPLHSATVQMRWSQSPCCSVARYKLCLLSGPQVGMLSLCSHFSSLGILWSLYLRRKTELRYPQPEYARG